VSVASNSKPSTGAPPPYGMVSFPKKLLSIALCNRPTVLSIINVVAGIDAVESSAISRDTVSSAANFACSTMSSRTTGSLVGIPVPSAMNCAVTSVWTTGIRYFQLGVITTASVSGTWWPSSNAHALRTCSAAAAHSALSGRVETVKSCRRGIAATNWPSSWGRVFDRSDFWKPAADFGRCFGHCVAHAWSRSSVVVMVASSDSVLASTASPYSVGMPATASLGTITR
jgi:hypothetical protein